jgi:hypothetical protein
VHQIPRLIALVGALAQTPQPPPFGGNRPDARADNQRARGTAAERNPVLGLPGGHRPLHALRHHADAKHSQTGADHAAPQAAFWPQNRSTTASAAPLLPPAHPLAPGQISPPPRRQRRADFSAPFPLPAFRRNRYAVLTVRSSQFISDQKFQRRIQADMRQRLIDVHHLRAEIFKLKALLLPEGLTRQPGRHLAGVDGQRLTVAQAVAAQRGIFSPFTSISPLCVA